MLETPTRLFSSSSSGVAIKELNTALKTEAFEAYGTKVCNVLCPAIITQDNLAHIGNAAVALAKALSTLANDLIRRPDFKDLFGLDDKTADVVSRSPLVVDEFAARCDGFINTNGEIQFIEFNCSTPGGMFFHDLLAKVFTPVVGQLYGPEPPTPVLAATHYVRALLSSVPQAAVMKTPRLCIVVPSGKTGIATRQSPELRDLQQRLMENAVYCFVATDEEVHSESGFLYTPDGPVDVVLVLNWADAITSLCVEHALFNPSRSPSTTFVNPASSCVTRGNKILFAYLYDQRFSSEGCQSVYNAVRPFVPPTYRLTDMILERTGDEISAVSFARKYQKDHVLKKANSLGGRDVHLGWTSSTLDWDNLLRQVRHSEYILQQRVVSPVVKQFGMSEDGDLTVLNMHYDLCPFVWGNKYSAGALVRLGGSRLLNMSSGHSSIVPLYVDSDLSTKGDGGTRPTSMLVGL